MNINLIKMELTTRKDIYTMSTEEITNTEDVIDSRDIIARLEYLEDEMECYAEDEELQELDFDHSTKWEEWEYIDEYKALKALADEADGYVADWQYGEALIRESYFTEYVEQFCDDVGYISDDLPWVIENNIDFDGIAEDFKVDYTELDFDGVTYFAR
jgi:hypothetical protein